MATTFGFSIIKQKFSSNDQSVIVEFHIGLGLMSLSEILTFEMFCRKLSLHVLSGRLSVHHVVFCLVILSSFLLVFTIPRKTG